MALSSIVVSAMGSFGFLWNELWFGVTFVAMLLAVPVFAFTPDEVAPPRTSNVARKGHSHIGFVTITLAYGLFGFGYVVLGTFISAMARSVPELATTEPYVWLLVGLSGIPTVVFWPWLGQRIGNDYALMLACAIEAIGVYVSVVLPDQTGIVMVGFNYRSHSPAHTDAVGAHGRYSGLPVGVQH